MVVLRQESKTILITGGLGFIGSHFTEDLFHTQPEVRLIILSSADYAGRLENLPPEILQSPRVELVRGDIRYRDLVQDLVQRSNKVIHFAAKSHVTRSIQDSLSFFEVNVMGTHTLAKAACQYGDHLEKFIYISTCEVYGDSYPGPISEICAQCPSTPYAASKAGAENLVYSFFKTYQLPVVVVRPFNTYGPKMHIEKVIPRFITNSLRGRPIEIHGDGMQRRDWMYVKDLTDGLLQILAAPPSRFIGEVINLGSGNQASIKEIAEFIVKELKTSPQEITYLPDRPGQIISFVPDISKAKKLLGWEPKVSLEEGLRQTIRWYKENKAWWQPLVGQETVELEIERQRRGY